MLFPQLLHSAGYATGMVGKWHLGHKKREYLPTHRGFDEYFGIPYSNDMRPVRLVDGDVEVEYPVVQATLTRRYTERALRFMERHRDRPFFFYFAHAMPHKPLACSESFYKKSGAGLYGDVLAELDWSVGRVLAQIKDLGLDERTLVIFTSDNGPWYGGSTGGLRGMKGKTWEGGYRVPCIARWPGRLPAGRVSDELGVTMDLFATALAAAGVAPPGDRVIDGQNLLPVLSGKTHSATRRDFRPRRTAASDGAATAAGSCTCCPRASPRDSRPGERRIDPRSPDGVTILAPFEQAALRVSGPAHRRRDRRHEPVRPNERSGRAAQRRGKEPRCRRPVKSPVRSSGRAIADADEVNPPRDQTLRSGVFTRHC